MDTRLNDLSLALLTAATATGAHDAYKLNAKVSWKGFNWNNTGSDANVWEPGVYGWVKI